MPDARCQMPDARCQMPDEIDRAINFSFSFHIVRLLSVIFSVFFLFSCNKDFDLLSVRSQSQWSEVERNFFNLNNDYLFRHIVGPGKVQARSVDPRLEEIYESLIGINDSLHFVPGFVQQFGYPYWSGALGLSEETNEKYLTAVPTLLPDANQLSGILLCSKSDGQLHIEFKSVQTIRNYIDSISIQDYWINARVFAGLILTIETALFDSTSLRYLHFLLDENEHNLQNAIVPRTTYYFIKICFLVLEGANPSGAYPAWIIQMGYLSIPISEWKPLSEWRALVGITITPQQYDELVKFYEDHGATTSSQYNGPLYQIHCQYYWVPIGSDPFDYIYSGNGGPGNTGPSGGGPPSSPIVNLGPHLLRLESCGGLGEPYDYGPSNPSGQHPDQAFCQQLQQLYDCLPFLASDQELVAWYLWYDANYPGNTWQSLYNFGCTFHMSPMLKEEGIRFFRNHVFPGSAYPEFNNDWETFLDIWKTIWTSALPMRHKRVISRWLDDHADVFWTEVNEVVNALEELYLADVNITPEEIECLLKQPGSAMQLNSYIQTSVASDPGLDAYMADLGSSAIDLLCADPQVKMMRMIDLDKLLLQKPDALLEDCLNNNPNINIQDYFHLFNFELPQSCKDRLTTLGNGWGWQPIEQGNVRKASLDYYPVEITQRPDFNNDGIPDSDSEIFHAVRMEFLSLADGHSEGFSSSCLFGPSGNVSWDFMYYDETDPLYSGPDRNIWPSNNPVSTIFFINATAANIAMQPFTDDGAVIVSDYCHSNCWTFSTIQTPASGSQPLSGNRQWGLTMVGGNLTFYNRAADRAHILTLLSTFFPKCAMNDYYAIGVHTWKNLQNHIRQFINEHGGQAVLDPNSSLAINPDWKYLYEQLKGTDTITSIPCINH